MRVVIEGCLREGVDTDVGDMIGYVRVRGFATNASVEFESLVKGPLVFVAPFVPRSGTELELRFPIPHRSGRYEVQSRLTHTDADDATLKRCIACRAFGLSATAESSICSATCSTPPDNHCQEIGTWLGATQR